MIDQLKLQDSAGVENPAGEPHIRLRRRRVLGGCLCTMMKAKALKAITGLKTSRGGR